MSLHSPAATDGLGGSLRALATALAETARVRIALLRLEAREEVRRRERWLLLSAVAVLFIQLSLGVASAFVVAAFWDTHRAATAIALALAYLAAGLALLVHVRRSIAASPAPFAATMREFERDFERPAEPS